jgi:signal transduction histidine kinase
MKFQFAPRHWLLICKVLGFSLLFFFRIEAGSQAGFFLLLVLIALFVLRLRIKKMELTIFIDCLLCILMMFWWDHAGYALLIVLFEALARKKYLALLTVIYFYTSPEFLLLFLTSGLGGYFLGCWADEKENDLKRHFELKGQIYELESLTDELAVATIQDARMATIAERARISREIHDNAGHDIIAAYISFQTLRGLVKDAEVLEMYDATLERLSDGVGKIRDILHNLTPTETPSIGQLEKICDEFPLQIEFKSYGNMGDVPAYIWNALATCLKESLTNVSRHAVSSYVKVEIDVSTHIVRLYVENDGVMDNSAPAGRGLANLRYRISAVGGNLSINKDGGLFKMICVVPLAKEVEKND